MTATRGGRDSLYKALGKTKYMAGKVSDYFMGITRVDNEKDPDSELNRRKNMTEVNMKHRKFMEETKKRGHVR